jgi:hypothetical protein
MPSSDHLRRCLQSFGTIYSDAIDSSDPNSNLGGDPLPADALGAQRGNPLRVQDLLRAPEALTLGACRLEACLHPLEIGMGNATLARPGASVQVPKSRRFVWDKRQNATEHQKSGVTHDPSPGRAGPRADWSRSIKFELSIHRLLCITKYLTLPVASVYFST